MPKKTLSIIAQPLEAVEVVDASDRPLGVMPLAEARRQALLHRVVLVLVYGTDGRLFLQRRSPRKRLYPGRWDLSCTGHVMADESREDAALRELQEELGIHATGLRRLAQVEAGPETGFGFVTLFCAGETAGPVLYNTEEVEGGMFVDADELESMVENFRDMLTPALVHFWDKGMLFPDR